MSTKEQLNIKWEQGIIRCEETIRKKASEIIGKFRSLPLKEACVLEKRKPLESHDGLSLYTQKDRRTFIIFHPCGVYTAAVEVQQKNTELSTKCPELLTGLSPDFGEHPDLFLSRANSLHGIVCLYVRREKLGYARMRLITREIINAAGRPEHVYEDREGISLIWAGQEDETCLLQCREILTHFDANAGFSGPFDRNISARGLMTKARLAAEQGREPGIISFTAVHWDRLWQEADRILEQTEHSPAEFCHPAIPLIAQSDQDQGTDYLNSLSVYLSSGRRLREAALQLDVHRNTLDYRIQRISDLFNIDTGNTSTCFELLFSLYLLKRYGKKVLYRPGGDKFTLPQAQSLLWASLEGRSIATTEQGKCRLLLISISNRNEDQLSRILSKTKEVFPDSALAFNDEIICLTLQGTTEECKNNAEDFTREMKLKGLFTHLLPLNEICLRLKLLRLYLHTNLSLIADGTLLLMREHLSDLFFLLLQSRIDLTPYYCDQVIRVMDRDYEKNSNLSGSLYVYLTNFMDMNDASAAAHIHRNTLEYQLKIIMALIGGGKPDEQLRFEMICTYRMLQMSGINRNL